MQTIPSILEKNSSSLFYQINKLSPYFSRFQIDIADGVFVPNKTVQIDDIIKEINGLPIKNNVYDFHLMVKDYESEIKKLEELKKLIKINYVFIHFSAISNFVRQPADQISNLSTLPIGLTLNPQDQVNDLSRQYDLNKIPFLQIMSVNPGFQGSPFLPEMLNKIEQLKNIDYGKEIFLDGAVNEKTIPIILAKKYQPDFICPGSYITKAEGKELEKRKSYLATLKTL